MKKHIVKLTQEERVQLKTLINKGKGSARKITHARVLLKADEGKYGEFCKDADISKSLDLGLRTVERIRERLVLEGLESALNRRLPRKTKEKKIDGDAEAHLVALACSKPPKGQAKWTLRLLADKMVVLNYIDSISHEGVRKTLKKTKLSLG
jgi:transposase